MSSSITVIRSSSPGTSTPVGRVAFGMARYAWPGVRRSSARSGRGSRVGPGLGHGARSLTAHAVRARATDSLPSAVCSSRATRVVRGYRSRHLASSTMSTTWQVMDTIDRSGQAASREWTTRRSRDGIDRRDDPQLRGELERK